MSSPAKNYFLAWEAAVLPLNYARAPVLLSRSGMSLVKTRGPGNLSRWRSNAPGTAGGAAGNGRSKRPSDLLPDHDPQIVLAGFAAVAAQFAILGTGLRLHPGQMHLFPADAGGHRGRAGPDYGFHCSHYRVSQSACGDNAR